MIATPSQLPTPGATSPAPSPFDRELLIAKLKARGLRVTAARIALLATLSSSPQSMTIEQLFLKIGSATCDLVTIYRAMAAFERAGVVYRSGFSERGAVLYNADFGGGRKYPLVSKGTSIVEELDQESAAELEATIGRIKHRLHARGYKALEHIVEFFAVSPA